MLAPLHLLWFLALVAGSHAACPAAPAERLELRGTTMGTVSWSVVAYAAAELEPELRTAIESALECVNKRMSTYKADSEVSRFNRTQSLDWFGVSRETAGVVARAQDISKASGGAFDVTVAPLVSLWQFGPDKSRFEIPDDATLDRVRKTIGYQKLAVRRDPPALKKSIPELQIDLSAIAKGYAVDLVAENLHNLGIDCYLIEVGGEVRASGQKPGGIPWTLGVEKPVADRRALWSVIELQHRSLASSGDYRNFYEVGGQRYSHTIDPRTGRPVVAGPASVSVIADDCMTADAIATAVMVCGKESGLALAKRMGVELLVLMHAPEADDFVAASTEHWPPNQMRNAPGKADADASIFRTIAVASVFFVVAVIAMSVGVLFGRQRIRGSCGGIAALDNPDIAAECSLCSAPRRECRELKKALRKGTQDQVAGAGDSSPSG